MIIFWRLILAHLLTDYTFQTNRIAEWKRKSVTGVAVHSFIFLVLALALTWQYLGETWWKFSGLASVILLSVIHFIEDQYRVWTIKRKDSPDNIMFFLWDQFIHVVFIFMLAPYDREIIGEKVIFILVLVIVLTHMASILMFYMERSFYELEHSITGLKKKYYLITERLVVFLSMLLPSPWWALFVLTAAGSYLLNRKLKLKFTRLNLIASIVLVVLCGILGRIVLY